MALGTKTEQLSRLAGKILIVGFEGFTLPPEIERRIERGSLGGVVLFSRNVESTAQVAALTARIRRLAPERTRPFVSVDQEGGRVVRFGSPLTHLPPARTFGELDDPHVTELAGRLVGDELRSLGVTVNFAPVLDVDTNPNSPVIGDRSYGREPERVVRHGLAFGQGLRSAGVLPCAKHFPGHGDTALDSHLSLPRTDVDLSRLRAVELAPFATWCQRGLGPIMTAHIIVSALDSRRPATASRTVIQDELKGRLGFTGPIFSDDLEMGAIRSTRGPVETAAEAVRAGVDGLIVSQSLEIQDEVASHLVREAKRDLSFLEQLKEAAANMNTITQTQESPSDVNWLGSKQHIARQNELSRYFRGTSI